jgi:hypothetical protein
MLLALWLFTVNPSTGKERPGPDQCTFLMRWNFWSTSACCVPAASLLLLSPLKIFPHISPSFYPLFASKMVRSACFTVLIVCLLAARVSAHGGALHPGGPEQNKFIRAKVASCKNWVAATGTLKDGKVVPSAAKLAPISVKVRRTPPCFRTQEHTAC